MNIPIILIDYLDQDFNEIKRPCEFIEREGKLLCCDNDAVDYYGEFRGGFPWVHPKLEEWAEKNGGYWEWENPEAVCFAK